MTDQFSRSSPAALELASLVRRSVGALARRLRAERPEDSLSFTKLGLLGRLYRQGSLSAAEVAALERIRPQSLTRVLAELTEDGFITRRPDAQDGRRLLIDITGDGRSALGRDMQQRDFWLAGAMAEELSDTERELLRLVSGLMDRLSDIPPSQTRSVADPGDRLR